ncbi:MAG TPA: hypothetical protein VGB97_03630 [Candidatus Paceibacterota bacterium]|jgi:predicted Rossmann-fold nucleotide-binding protein
MASISDLKGKANVSTFASTLGKSTIAKDSPEYQLIEQAVEVLIDNGYGILHGGYAGGAMSAASDTANRLIQEKGLPKEINIGVPQKEHDGLWERVTDSSFTEAAEDIFVRLKVVTSGDIVVICPLGGDGTELEETIVFHENVIRNSMGEQAKPLIFLQTPEGTDWRKLIETKLALLDTSVKTVSEYSWLYFVDSIEAFGSLVTELKGSATSS